MMELVYVHYNKDGKNNYFYFIPLFQRSHGELAGLRTRDGRGLCLLTDGEVSKIKVCCANRQDDTRREVRVDDEEYR
jgi:hypothetical protein